MSTLGAVTLLGRFLSPPRHPRPSRRQSDSENFLLSAFWPRRNCLPERFCSSPGRRLMVPAPQLGGGDARPRRRGLALPRPLGVTAPGDLGTHVCGPGAHLPGSSRWRSRGPAKRSELAGRSAFAPAQAALRKLFQPSPIPPQPPPAPPEPGSVSPEAAAFAAAEALGPGVRGSAATTGAASRRPSGASSCPGAGSRRTQPAIVSARRLAAGALGARSPARASRLPPPRRAAPPGGGRAKGRVCPASRGSPCAPRRRAVFFPPTEKKGKRGGALVNRPPPS